MLIDIPNDLARKAKGLLPYSAEEYRRLSKLMERSNDLEAIHLLVEGAIANAHFPEPLVVGHTATWNGSVWRVLYLGQSMAFIQRDGIERSVPIRELIYAGPAGGIPR